MQQHTGYIASSEPPKRRTKTPATWVRICRSEKQSCIHCGKVVGKGNKAITMNNCNDDLVICKNLWLHLECKDDFAMHLRLIS
tara:strand:+ start:969 stop:1217 length:249 start_codon:yes stop_codon:yes gene_type:complete